MDPLLLNSDTYQSGGTARYNAYMSGYTERTSLELLSGGRKRFAHQPGALPFQAARPVRRLL